MKRLFLIRHAKSSWKYRGLRDHDRPLNGRGRGQLELMRDVVQAQGALDGPVFCSTARRARLTVEGLLAGAVQPRVEFDSRL
ncbi:MAG: histidine phosphatase, partial [Candidatus Competibacteraceae bacterium]